MNSEKLIVFPITLTGKVVHGKGLGRTVGMPTANLHILEGELPPLGVYAARLIIGEHCMDSVANIGTRPSVDDECKVTIEVNIFDFDEDIYGKVVHLELHKFLRQVQKFEDLQAVRRQVEKDILEAKVYFSCYG